MTWTVGGGASHESGWVFHTHRSVILFVFHLQKSCKTQEINRIQVKKAAD